MFLRRASEMVIFSSEAAQSEQVQLKPQFCRRRAWRSSWVRPKSVSGGGRYRQWNRVFPNMPQSWSVQLRVISSPSPMSRNAITVLESAFSVNRVKALGHRSASARVDHSLARGRGLLTWVCKRGLFSCRHIVSQSRRVLGGAAGLLTATLGNIPINVLSSIVTANEFVRMMSSTA